MREASTPKEKAAAANLRRIFEVKKFSAERLTQRKLADLVGFRQQTAVSQYLRGKNVLGVEAIAKFAAALNVPPEEIRPDFYELLQITGDNRPSTAVKVRFCTSGKKPPVGSIITSTVRDPAAVDQYAVHINSDAYRQARIKKNAHLIVATGLTPRPDDDVFLIRNKKTYIGRLLRCDDNEVTIESLEDNEELTFARDSLLVFDVVTAVENPPRR